jgi:hypothetical protein
MPTSSGQSSADDEASGAALMAQASAAIAEGVEGLAAGWVTRVVADLVDAWGGLEPAAREATLEAARRAGAEGAARVNADLRSLFATDPAEQRTTPLEIVRSLRFEATAVLEAAGVPEVERDPFDRRSFPDDLYGIVPRSLADLGDEDLAPMLMAWGLGKARVLRARAPQSGPEL